jgi:hypothetical protein
MVVHLRRSIFLGGNVPKEREHLNLLPNWGLLVLLSLNIKVAQRRVGKGTDWSSRRSPRGARG